MLTGGPSVWYAQHLAALENASILITGYQDEEAPGKRLLDLAEQKNSTLDLNGATVQVRCHVAKYSLSAHADGGELAAYAAVLKPRRVALVHGDEDARHALRASCPKLRYFCLIIAQASPRRAGSMPQSKQALRSAHSTHRYRARTRT